MYCLPARGIFLYRIFRKNAQLKFKVTNTQQPCASVNVILDAIHVFIKRFSYFEVVLLYCITECINFTKPIVNAITTLEQKVSESPRKTQSAQISAQSPNTPERQTRAVTKTKERQTRADKQTKAQQRIVSPTPSTDCNLLNIIYISKS